MIYIRYRRPSASARELITWLNTGGLRARRWRDEILQTGHDLVVCWGDPLDDDGTPVLNSNLFNDKLNELRALRDGQVPTPSFIMPEFYKPRPNFVGRNRHHHGANDLLRGVRNPDYWVEIVPVVDEFRVHVFRDAETRRHVVIRVGLKVPAPGLGAPGTVGGPHPVYRSRNAGWRIDYGTGAQTAIARYRGVRDVAKRAVCAVGYDFGAVDVGVDTRTNLPVVFEVNSAPGLAGGTVGAYGRHIAAWAEQYREG